MVRIIFALLYSLVVITFLIMMLHASGAFDRILEAIEYRIRTGGKK